MKRVIGLFAVMLILSLPAWTRHDCGGDSGGAPPAPSHGPEPFHGSPNVEARIGSTYNVRLGLYVQYFG
jgi:hypothetical protein